jgi:hypothetical protein
LVIILLIPYSLFLFEFLAKEITFKNIVKVFAAVSGPIPIAIFIAYIFVAQKSLLKEINESHLSALASFSYLFVSLLMTIICLYFFETLFYKQFSETVIPIFLNSLVLMMYIVNILITKHIQIIALLSGISMGISIYVLFIS